MFFSSLFSLSLSLSLSFLKSFFFLLRTFIKLTFFFSLSLSLLLFSTKKTQTARRQAGRVRRLLLQSRRLPHPPFTSDERRGRRGKEQLRHEKGALREGVRGFGKNEGLVPGLGHLPPLGPAEALRGEHAGGRRQVRQELRRVPGGGGEGGSSSAAGRGGRSWRSGGEEGRRRRRRPRGQEGERSGGFGRGRRGSGTFFKRRRSRPLDVRERCEPSGRGGRRRRRRRWRRKRRRGSPNDDDDDDDSSRRSRSRSRPNARRQPRRPSSSPRASLSQGRRRGADEGREQVRGGVHLRERVGAVWEQGRRLRERERKSCPSFQQPRSCNQTFTNWSFIFISLCLSLSLPSLLHARLDSSPGA